MKLIIRKVIMLGIISTILAFYYLAFSTSTNQEKLQAITDQIDTALSKIEQKGNQPRVLSAELIKELSIFANSCPLEKVLVDGQLTTELYSVEKGKLLLALLNRKLDPSTYKKIFEMVSFQNAFLKDANLKDTNLSRIQLSRAYLVGVVLSNSNLEGVNLYKANLSKANLNATNLEIANLREAILSDTDMSNAILKNAYLIDAKLGGKIKLDNADFTGANLNGIDFRKGRPPFVKP